MTDQTTATKTMAHLQKATAHWKAFQKGVGEHATRTAGARQRSDTEQTDGTEWHKAQLAKEGN
jgi:hypothetical protein